MLYVFSSQWRVKSLFEALGGAFILTLPLALVGPNLEQSDKTGEVLGLGDIKLLPCIGTSSASK